MLIITAMLLIFSTYAWFSVNRVVTLDNIHAKVAAAEGLQISIDGENWSAAIDISKDALSDLGVGINNYKWPETLSPVSTAGKTASGDLVMYAGEVSADGSYLTGAAANTSNYIVFDVYFKNSSSQTSDKLQLNVGSMVQVTTEALRTVTGLENCVRAGIVLYSNTATMTASAADVRALAAGDSPTVAIWEPNYNQHISEVVSNDSRISGSNSTFTTLGLDSINLTGDKVANINVSSAAEDTAGNLKEQKTVTTDGTVTAVTDLTTVEDGTMTLPGNSISKARVYIWLEGQDPDCIDTASTGQQLDFTLSFTKPVVSNN
jgi:hypothetical protein